MSQESIERVYTINLGKVLLSPNNQRAKRAINMIREFATRHMKSENIKIEEDVSHLVWQRGIRHPPRKIRVKLTKDEDGNVLISKYQDDSKEKKEKAVEEKPKSQKTDEKLEEGSDKIKEEKTTEPSTIEKSKESKRDTQTKKEKTANKSKGKTKAKSAKKTKK